MGVTVENINIRVTLDNQQAIKNTENFRQKMEESRKALDQFKPNSSEFNAEMQKLIKSTQGFVKSANFNDIKREFNALQRAQKNATEGTKEYIIATAQLRVVGKRLGDLKASMKGLQTETQRTEGFFKRLISQGNAVRLALVGALAAGIGMLKGYGKEFINFYDTQAKADAQLKTVLISTNNAAGRSFEQLKKQAGDLQGTTLFGDEETEKAQALLLTFTNVRTEVFDKTIPLAQDYATALANAGNGTADMKSAVTQLGKALNDPVKGINALSRAGVVFDDQQKAQIKTLVESGRTVEAQNLILQELQKEFGGSAAAAAKAGAGGLTQLDNTIGDIKESAGELLVNVINPFIPRLIQLGQNADKFVKNLKNAPQVIKRNLDIVVLFTTVIALFNKQRILSTAITAKNTAANVANRAALIASNTATKTATAVQTTYTTLVGLMTGRIKLVTVAQRALNLVMRANPIGLVITAIGLAVAAFIRLYNTSETTRATLAGLIAVGKELFKIIGEVARSFAQSTREAFAEIQENAKPLITFLKKVVDFYIDSYGKILQATTGFAGAFGKIIKGNFKGAIGEFQQAFSEDSPLKKFGEVGARLGKTYLNAFNMSLLTNENKKVSEETGKTIANNLVNGFTTNVDGSTTKIEKAVRDSIEDLKSRIKKAKSNLIKVTDVEIQTNLIQEIKDLETLLDVKEKELKERVFGEKIVVVKEIEIDIKETQVTPQLNEDALATPGEFNETFVQSLQLIQDAEELESRTQLTEAKIALFQDETLAAEERSARLQLLEDEYQLKVIANAEFILQNELALKEMLGQLDEEYFQKKQELLDLSVEKSKIASEIQVAQQSKALTAEEKIQEKREKIYGDFLVGMTKSFGTFLDGTAEGRKKAAKDMIFLALDTVEKLVLLNIVGAQTGSLASPQSIGTGGIAGIAQAAFLTGLIKAAFSVIKSQITASFEQGGIAPLAKGKGGLPQGPSHKQGGIKMFDGQTGRFVGELQGGEPILSTETYKNNKEEIDRLLYSSMFQGGKKVFMEGGFVPSAPSSSVISNISNLQNSRISTRDLQTKQTEQIAALDNRFNRLEDLIGNYPTHLKSFVLFEEFLEAQATYNETIADAGG